jgi:hypothetical protein
MTAEPEEVSMSSCTFCFKPSTGVQTLVAGPGVFICDECVMLCQVVIQNKPTSSPAPLAPWDHVNQLDDVLATLPRVAMASAQVEATLAGWVGRSRSLGATWARVGEALGMSRQSAWERFAPGD